jgi:hypothetical protein
LLDLANLLKCTPPYIPLDKSRGFTARFGNSFIFYDHKTTCAYYNKLYIAEPLKIDYQPPITLSFDELA